MKAAGQMLAAAGSPVPVTGFFAQDPAAAQRLWAGEVNRKLAKSELISSARSLAENADRLVAAAGRPGRAGYRPACCPAGRCGGGRRSTVAGPPVGHDRFRTV